MVVVSRSDVMIVHFVTDGSVNYRGFSASYHQLLSGKHLVYRGFSASYHELLSGKHLVYRGSQLATTSCCRVST